MLDWLGVTFVSKASSECDRVEALHCERQALEKIRSLTCVMRDHFQSVAQFSQKVHTDLVNYYYYYYYYIIIIINEIKIIIDSS